MFHLNLNTALLMSEANCRPVEEGNDLTLIDVTTTLIEVQALFTVSTTMKPLQQRIQNGSLPYITKLHQHGAFPEHFKA